MALLEITMGDSAKVELVEAKVLQIFLNQNVERYFAVDLLGDTLLHYAAKFGLVNLIQVKLAHLVALNVTNANKETPIHVAIEHRQWETVRELLELANNEVLDKYYSPLNVPFQGNIFHLVLYYYKCMPSNIGIHLVQVLLAKHLQLELQTMGKVDDSKPTLDPKGMNMLMMAIAYANEEAVLQIWKSMSNDAKMLFPHLANSHGITAKQMCTEQQMKQVEQTIEIHSEQ